MIDKLLRMSRNQFVDLISKLKNEYENKDLLIDYHPSDTLLIPNVFFLFEKMLSVYNLNIDFPNDDRSHFILSCELDQWYNLDFDISSVTFHLLEWINDIRIITFKIGRKDGGVIHEKYHCNMNREQIIHKNCWYCGLIAKCSTCSKCKLARYCSKSCQTKAWEQCHKKTCKHLNKL